MKLNEIATLILGVLTLAWTIWTAVRASREKRSLERIEGLLRVKSTLEDLDTLGLDPSVGQERRDKSQKEQLETVTVALRRVSAAYVGLVHKAVPSYFAAAVFVAYSFWSGIMTYGLMNPKPADGKPVDSSSAAANGIAAIVAAALCVVFFLLAIFQWARARRARVILRDAGIDLRRPLEKAKAYFAAIAELFSGRSVEAEAAVLAQRREQRDAASDATDSGIGAVPSSDHDEPPEPQMNSRLEADEAESGDMEQRATAQLGTPDTSCPRVESRRV